ncbi:GNAT family N-acetyltransferase [Clostridium sediminicola]|uniref:GNAT family N-acetyltransferase n=1 Tax=Clostridium sediminicola TaxID=3114879 RepID=UPI0031F25223
MSKFHLISGSIELLDSVEPLWKKLNKYHEINSNHFTEKFKSFTFDVRKNKFIDDKNLKVKIDLLKDNEKDIIIGYCISTINKELLGEIDSLFIEKDYRKYGLGDRLMKRAIEWLNNYGVKKKIIGVAEGNENVLEFYKKYGFFKKVVILEEI